MTTRGLLAGKRILVTGIADAGSIAHATAAAALAQGATVVATAMVRDLDGARAAIAEIDSGIPVLAMDATAADDLATTAGWISDTSAAWTPPCTASPSPRRRRSARCIQR